MHSSFVQLHILAGGLGIDSHLSWGPVWVYRFTSSGGLGIDSILAGGLGIDHTSSGGLGIDLHLSWGPGYRFTS